MGGKLCKCQPRRNDIVEQSTLCCLDARSRYSHRSIEQDYDLHQSTVLGTGFSGPVTLAINKHTGQHSAVKSFDKQNITKKKMDFLRAEVNIYLQVDHPHVARLLHVYEEEEGLSLVMELCTGKELYHRLAKKKVFSEREAALATYQMCLAISYLHRHHIVHRDIKLENWLYESDAENAKLKLIDFGFSKLWDENTEMEQSCGSIAYVAPEVLGQHYTDKCDMWSLGVIVFMLLGGYPPFHSADATELISKIKKCDYSFRRDKWEHTTEYARDFIVKLLVSNPNDRMSAFQALEHPWMTKIEEEVHADNWMDSMQTRNTSANLLDDLRRYAKGSHFKHLALSIMAHHLSSSELEEIREAFLALDVDKNGGITFKELRAALNDQFNVTEEELQGIFEVINVTHDKEIHYSEFIAAVMQTRVHMDKNLLRETFDHLDVNHTGKISKKDLRKVIGGNKFEDTDISSLMSECQGCTSKSGISFEKFSEHLQSIDSIPLGSSSTWSFPSHASSPKQLGQFERTSFRSRESCASTRDQSCASSHTESFGSAGRRSPSPPVPEPGRPQEDVVPVPVPAAVELASPSPQELQVETSEFDFGGLSGTLESLVHEMQHQSASLPYAQCSTAAQAGNLPRNRVVSSLTDDSERCTIVEL